MAATAALGSAEQVKTNTVKITCKMLNLESEAVVISADETLKGLVDKVRSMVKMTCFDLWWDGRPPTKPDSSYMAFWHDYEGPAINLSSGAPESLLKLTGATKSNTFTKVTPERFANLKVADVCDLKHRNEIFVLYKNPQKLKKLGS